MFSGLLFTVVGASLTSALPAQRGEPASLLLFPEYRSEPGIVCLVTVTNAELAPGSGNVLTRWNYIEGASCLEFNRTAVLTPGDTLSVITSVHNPDSDAGYLYVHAVDQNTGEPTSHDHLIGHATILNGLTTTSYAVDPVTYRAVGDGDVNGDGRLNLDGVEYEMAADQILIPRFLGQDKQIQSDLIMVDLTGGLGSVTVLNFLIYNDNEEAFSSQYQFTCWNRVPLEDISGVFENDFLRLFTSHDPGEYVGNITREAGWFRADGAFTILPGGQVETDPAFLLHLVDRGPNWASGLPADFIGRQGNGSPSPAPPPPDCNGNGVPDSADIASGLSPDCNGNGVPDECDVASGDSPDCNNNGVPDECDLASNLSPDCNNNGTPDECELASDCNGNGIPDDCDPDADSDGVPDDCDLECDNNIVLQLWPANRQIHSIDLEGLIDPLPHSALDADIVITAITQDEAVDGGGGPPWARVCDGDGVGSSVALLRAERLNSGNGRVYQVQFTATGPHGQTCDGAILVTVRKKQHTPAIDDGQTHDSTQNCP